jgi:RNA recognition motif-containing protein
MKLRKFRAKALKKINTEGIITMKDVDNAEKRDSDVHTVASTDVRGTSAPETEFPMHVPDHSVHESSIKLFVGSLPYDIKEEDMIDVFVQFGEVQEFTILRDRVGRSKGCAALRYSESRSAELCIETLHNKFCCGNVPTPLQVRYFERREQNPGNCYIDGLPYCFAPHLLWMSLASSYGQVSNVYPDGMNPFAAYVSFTKKSSASLLSADGRSGSICIAGVQCPSARVTLINQPVVYPFGYYPAFPSPPVMFPPHSPTISPSANDGGINDDPPVKLFVGCLPYSKTAQDIADLFTPFGDLLEVAILTDFGGKSRGAAFVTFSRTSDARKAVDSLKDFSFPKSTRNINISFAYKQNIWKSHVKTSETGTAASCSGSLGEEGESPISMQGGPPDHTPS